MSVGKPIFQAFRQALHDVIDKYGDKYYNNPEFLISEDKKWIERLAELTAEESGIDVLTPNETLNQPHSNI
jgi:hypothetical protein